MRATKRPALQMRDMLHLAVFKKTPTFLLVRTERIRRTTDKIDSSEDIQMGFDPKPDRFNY